MKGDASIIVEKSRHVLLLDEINVGLLKAEIAVFFEDLNGTIMSIIRDHNAKRNHRLSTLETLYSLSASVDILSIILDISIVFLHSADRETDLNA